MVRPTITITPKYDGNVNKLKVSVLAHRRDVMELVKNFIEHHVLPDVLTHDMTKVTDFKVFETFLYNKLFKTKGNNADPNIWYNLHYKERHHVFDYNGSEDLHLGDLLHLCADWIAAAKARDMKRQLFIEDRDALIIKETVYLCFLNTLKIMDDETKVIKPFFKEES